MIIDTHCHLAFPDFDHQLDEVINKAEELGVHKMITIACGENDFESTIKIVEKYDNVFASFGLHPDRCQADNFAQQKSELEKYASHPKVVAIGEAGFDFYRAENPSEAEQEEAFCWQIDLAKKVSKPVIIHLRNAREKALAFLEKNHDFPFVVHCFTEDRSFANKIFDWGGYIGLGGIITFKNCADELRELAKSAPLDRILLETDAPFLAPTPFRGQRNEAAYTRYVAEFLADLRAVSLEEIAWQSSKNAESFFNI